MLTFYNILGMYKSISIDKLHNFLIRKCIEYQCTEFEINRIQDSENTKEES